MCKHIFLSSAFVLFAAFVSCLSLHALLHTKLAGENMHTTNLFHVCLFCLSTQKWQFSCALVNSIASEQYRPLGRITSSTVRSLIDCVFLKYLFSKISDLWKVHHKNVLWKSYNKKWDNQSHMFNLPNNRECVSRRVATWRSRPHVECVRPAKCESSDFC